MDATSLYTLLTSLTLSLSALPHLFFPTLTTTLLSPLPPSAALGDTSPHLCRSLALAQLALALLSLLHSGMVPLSSLTSESEATTPYKTPTVWVTMLYHVAALVEGWAEFTSLGGPDVGFGGGSGGGGGRGGGSGGGAATAGPRALYGLGVCVSGALACWGLGCLLFGNGETGAGAGNGKVSGWPFRNEEERRQKREKRERKMGLGKGE